MTYRFFRAAPLLFLVASSTQALATEKLAESAFRSGAIPALARKYQMACSDCHVHGARLTRLGEISRYRGPSALAAEPVHGGAPVTLWGSVFFGNSLRKPDVVQGLPARLEAVAFDRMGPLGYMVEWWPVSFDLLPSGDVRDRSGRFEDIYVDYDLSPDLRVQAGQFRAISQYDASRRISISEMAALNGSLAGEPSADARLTAVRAFSPSGRSPSLRLTKTFQVDPEGTDGWYAVATVPFSGEINLPLTSDARRNASFELEGRPKGAFLELYRQDGTDSLGVNAFFGSEHLRWLGFVATKSLTEQVFADFALGSAKDRTGELWRSSLDLIYIPEWAQAYGVRFDAAERTSTQLVPYASFHLGGNGEVWRLAVEGRFRHGQTPVFALEIHFLR